MAKVKITIYRKVLQSYTAEVEVPAAEFGSDGERPYLLNDTKDSLSAALSNYAPEDAWDRVSADYDTSRKDEFTILDTSGLVYKNGEIVKVG